MLDGEGRLLALNTRRLGEGFYSALPAHQAFRARVEALGAGDAPARRRLGLVLAPAAVARRLRRAVGLPERDGLLVRDVEVDGPAARAGLRTGDLLVEADGQVLGDADLLHDALQALDEGVSLDLVVVRGTEELHVSVSFAADGPPDTSA